MKKMFEIIKSDTNYNFTGKFFITSIFSIILVGISLFGIFTKMQYGVDFRGGAEVQVKFTEKINVGNLRKSLAQFGEVSVQSIGELTENEYLVKVPATDDELNKVTQGVSDTLNKDFAAQGVEVRKIDIVGPKAGAELRFSGFQAMLWALIAIMVYIGLRFDFKYSPGAIIALFHDVSIILGVFAFTGTEFTLQTVAAVLAVIGYSVNDTVIVYDRVREHEQTYPARTIYEHINGAINETLSRTVLTSLTTLFVSAIMFFMGGAAIKDFFLAITLGVVVGTYSSVFVAAPVVVLFSKILKKDTESNGSVAKA